MRVFDLILGIIYIVVAAIELLGIVASSTVSVLPLPAPDLYLDNPTNLSGLHARTLSILQLPPGPVHGNHIDCKPFPPFFLTS